MKKTNCTDAPVIDRALVEQARTGDEHAFSQLYELTSPQLYRSIHAMVRDEDLAWDIQQDTYLRAWRSLDKLRDPDSLLPWLRRIAVNVTATELAQKRALNFTELAGDNEREPFLPDPREDYQPEPALARKELSRQVREIVKGLSPEQQLVMGMFYFEGMSIQEIAKLLKVTPGTVKTQLHRGRKGVEKEVLELKKQGVSLWGLSPLSYLLALLRHLEPEPEKTQKALNAVLEQAPAGAATVTAITAGHALLRSIGTKLLAVLLAASVLAGGKTVSDALRKGQEPELGDYRPPHTEILADEDEQSPRTKLRHTILNELLNLLPEENRPVPPATEPADPSEEPQEPTGESTGSLEFDPDASSPNELGSYNPVPDPPSSSDPSPDPTPSDSQESTASSTSDEISSEPEDNPPRLMLSGNCGENTSWKFYTDGLLTIEGTGSFDANKLFTVKNLMKSVSLQNGVTEIPERAFENSPNLTSVTIPGSVKSIGDFAFGYCPSLTDVMIEYGVTRIGSYMFYKCAKLRSIQIPESVTEIGYRSFGYCESLTEITIPSNVSAIDYIANPFLYCTGLEKINLASGNRSFSLDVRGILYTKDMTTLIACPGAFTGSCTIPAGVETISECAFSSVKGLTSVSFPESLKIIGPYAFEYCTGLSEVSIPDSVTKIEYNAFSYCSSLETVKLPRGLSIISSYLFYRCVSLRSIDIPASVTWIGLNAFDVCYSLTTVTIPDSVYKIEPQAFRRCVKLTSITIPNSVMFIGNDVFHESDLVTIYGKEGSLAETYANENGIPFEAIP